MDSAKGCMNPSKCQLAREKIVLLGHVVSMSGLEMMPEKLEAILALTALDCVTGVRSILGKAKYYHHFMEDFSEALYPMTLLTRKEVPFH